MTDDQIKLNEFRDKEIQDRLTRLADGWGGYNLNYVYDELFYVCAGFCGLFIRLFAGRGFQQHE